MKQTLLLLILLILSSNLYSQYTYFKEAVVTKIDNQRLQGYVEKYSESKLNPKIKFKIDLNNNDIEEIPVSEIKELLFLSDSTIFQSIPYVISRDSSIIPELRLAKKIVDGYAQLFKLQLPEEELSIIFEHDNTFVYILHINENYYVLNQEEELFETSYKLRKNYQGRLIYLLRDYKDLQDRARNLLFSDKQFISLIDDLNKNETSIESSVIYKKEKVLFKHEIGLGYSLFRSTNNIIGRGITVGYDFGIINPAFNEKLSSNIGVFWNYYEMKEYSTNYQSIRIPIGVTYRLNKNKIAPYIKSGVTIYLYENILHDQDLSKYMDFLFNVKVGIKLYKSVDINIERDFSLNPIIQPYNFMYFNVGYNF